MKDFIEKMRLKTFGNTRLKHYGVHTIKGRAFPNLTDGLKPVHRRILWSMYQKRLVPEAKALKAAVTIGEAMGSYHPHGDAPLAQSMANMVMLHEPLIDGNGSNWGSLTEKEAAYRYTEAKLSGFSHSNFFDPAYIATMPMEPNYDGRLLEPVALPSNTFHMIVNGAEGIGVGVTCHIPSFTLASVNKLTRKALKSDKRVTPKQAAEILEFGLPFGGRTIKSEANDKAILNVMEHGTGSVAFEPEYSIEDKGKTLVITGVPMKMRNGTQITRASNHTNVQTLTDESSIESGIRLVARAKRGVTWNEKTIAPIIKMFSTRNSYRVSYLLDTVIEKDGETHVESTLVQTGIIDALYDWIGERKNAFSKATKWKIEQEHAKLSKLETQMLAHKHRDVVDACRDKKDPKAFLKSKLKIDDAVADYILGLTVMQLTRINSDKLQAKIDELSDTIMTLTRSLKKPTEGIVKELKAL